MTLINRIAQAVLSLALGLFAPGAGAQSSLPDGGFTKPIACQLGADCWVMNYPDMAAGPKVLDPACGRRSYDGHKGTDIAIRDLDAMRQGVTVLSAAPGRVLRVRDGLVDRLVSGQSDRVQLQGRECGNGVVIKHSAGWETQYCHLRQGSVVVRPGERLGRGQAIGRVGLSGRTEFPHLHFALRFNGTIIDPLTARARQGKCGITESSLWGEEHLSRYRWGAIYAIGVADGPVSKRALLKKAAGPATLPRSASNLVVWATAFGVAPGDKLSFAIFAPDGRRLHQRETRIERHQAWRFVYSGLRRRGELWAAGRYRALVGLNRSGRKHEPGIRRHLVFEIR